MSNPSVVDVLICGAGAAGLTLAIELARRNVSFRLIEKMDAPFHGSRGKGIQPRTLEVLEDLGVLDRIIAAGGVYPPQRDYGEDGSYKESQIIDPAEPTPAEPYPMPWLLPQFLTERILRTRLLELGRYPEFGSELVEFSQVGNGVMARVVRNANEEVIHAHYLVGADGGHSFVRKALGIDFPGKTLGVRGLVADVTMTGLERDAWHRFNHGSMERQVSICPLAGTDLFQIQAPIPLEGEIDLSAGGLTTMLGDRAGRDDLQVRSVSWASAFHMNARLADRYRVQNAFLVGDAAHTHPPTGGQGLNTSLQDAYNLGWKLAMVTRGAPKALLDSYEEERRPIAASVLGLATKFLDAAKRGDTRRGREARQLDLGYLESSLALELPQRTRGPFAGDRAPDAPIRGASGQPTRLFDLFKGTHWTLLGYHVKHDLVSPRPGLHIHVFGEGGDVIDNHGHFEHGYGVTPRQWVLVRPDGYVGAIVSSDHIEALEDYLQDVGLGAENSVHA
ncbi:MAG TPA: FAD-dependent oxidoreductase [Dyella sp.]|uniref:FAD-dependent oxidoreductase n=1 Tax=Dyella sp. TaxID=1869338 RepID=UPI002CA401DF|nr:FAD-dependent oxidoreductase [Dyella sp.]HTV86015.1 FAD-dependent oxidoreductase [Dyella sp.]